MRKSIRILLGFGMLLGIGCSTDSDNDLNNKNLSTQEVKAQMQVNSATEGLDELLATLLINDKSGSSDKSGSDCTVISFAEKSISLAFSQCKINGNLLDGTITLTGNDGNMEGTEGVFIISFDAFKFNGYLLDGTKSVTFDFSVANNPVFTIATDVTLKNSEGEIIGHKGNKVLTWHLDQLDTDEPDFSWTGSWDIVHNGTTYSFEVTEPLSGTLGCAYITSGILGLEVNGLMASLDFGQGTCDQKGTVSYPDGKTEEITW